MRPFSFISLLLLCNLYGLVFDLATGGSVDGLYCNLVAAQSCLISQPVDHWLSVLTLLLLPPAICTMLVKWCSNSSVLIKTSAFLGLLLVTP
ncbi:MAG: hypothetical protein PVI79_15305 [Gammaproteobacteria bacterium]|jgi:hypothetical protein